MQRMDAAQERARAELHKPAYVEQLEPVTLHQIVSFIKQWRLTAGYSRICNLLLELDNQMNGTGPTEHKAKCPNKQTEIERCWFCNDGQ
jgi:hypothetical protein